MQGAIEIGHFEAQNDVRIHDGGAGAFGLVERVARGKIHAPALIDDGGLQGLREFDQARKARRRARGAIGKDDGIFRGDQQPRRFGYRSGIALRGRGQRKFWNVRLVVRGDGIFLQLAIGHQDHGQCRRRHGNLVGAHGGLAEMRERGGEIVPLGEIANHGGRVLNAVRPFHAGHAFGGVHDVSENQINAERGRNRRCKRPWPRAARQRCRARAPASGLPSILA